MTFGRMLLEKETEKLIEFQSGFAPLGTLMTNARNAGLDVENLEEKYVDKLEYERIMAKQELPIKKKTDIEKLVEYAKLQGWI